MATKTYNNNTTAQKTLIGNWAEERYWAETAENPERDFNFLARNGGHSTKFITGTYREEWQPQTIQQSEFQHRQLAPLPTEKLRTTLKTREMINIAEEKPAEEAPKTDFRSTYKQSFTSVDGDEFGKSLAAGVERITYDKDVPVTVWSHKLSKGVVSHGISATTGTQPFAKNSRFSQPITEFVATQSQHQSLGETEARLKQTTMGTSNAAQLLAEHRDQTATGISAAPGTVPGRPSTDVLRRDARLQDILGRMRAALKSRGEGGVRGLALQFRIADTDGSRQLTLEEFATCMHRMSVPITDDEITYVFRCLDRSCDGLVDFEELLIGLRGKLDGARLAIVQKAFAKMDKDNSGYITVDDLKGTYNARKHPDVIRGTKSEDQVLREFLTLFDCQNPDGIVTANEWEQYYTDVSASIDRSDYFDLMMRNAWKL